MSSLIGKEDCQSIGNNKMSSSYSDDFDVSNLIGPKKIKRPKYDWKIKKPQGQAKKGKINPATSSENFNRYSMTRSVSSLFEDDHFSGSKNLSDLFYNNEYGRD